MFGLMSDTYNVSGSTMRLRMAIRRRIRVIASADAERMRIQAAAAASYNRVALDRMLIDQLPQIVREAAAGLANANINVLNGAEGLGQIAAGLVGQGLTIFDSIKSNIASNEHEPTIHAEAVADAETVADVDADEPVQPPVDPATGRRRT